MGTIVARKRKDGSVGYTAQIRIKHEGKIIHTESQTFERKPAASQWLKRRETELSEPGALAKTKEANPTLAEVIQQYLNELRKPPGKTKKQVLQAIRVAPIGALRCTDIGSQQILEFAHGLNVKPQTVGNYLAHLGTIFKLAKPAWGYPLDPNAIEAARTVGKKMGITSKSKERTRRPTLQELDTILQHYHDMAQRRKAQIDMIHVILFGLFSARRLEEITRITWEDLDEVHSEVMVRDMKHPGEKIGNDVRVNLPAEALAVIQKRTKPKNGKGNIFPYNAKSASSSFTRACTLLGVEDLHFHDLRHEGVSRLFELGKSIPQVAAVSGHRSWQSLKRYTHIRATGDKYLNWKWNPLTSTLF